MRRAAKVDRNQAEIVDALRRAGCSVYCLHSVGKGFPDLLVGRAGRNKLMEVKDGALPPSARKLTPDEEKFHQEWRGEVVIVYTPEDALREAFRD